VYNPPVVMAEHDKHIENARCGSRNCEEINSGYTVGMVFEKRPPGLRGRFLLTNHILGNCRFRYIDTKLDQFPIDSRSTPTDIRRLHLPDELAYFFINRRSPHVVATTFPSPVQPKIVKKFNTIVFTGGTGIRLRYAF
jgi:hypothetical protein